MILSTTTHVIIMAALVPISILFHEMGHYVAAKSNDLNPRFGFDKKGLFVAYNSDGVDSELRANIIIFGVVAGFFPVMLAVIGIHPLYLLWVVGWYISNMREIDRYRRVKRGLL